MPSKREILELLTAPELRAIFARLGLDVGPTGDRAAEGALVESLSSSKQATLPKILAGLTTDRLTALCRATRVDEAGANARALIRQLTKTDSSTRLWGLVARDARTAVILRRGPSKQVRMLLWDLATDTITPGQWLSGRLYDEKNGISPNGKLIVYFAGKFKTKLGTFTAVSRPPYFTALALWPEGSTYGGGGFFEDDHKLILNYGRVIKELNDNATLPANFVVSGLDDYRKRHGEEETAVSQQGWLTKSKGGRGELTAEGYVYSSPWVYEKPNPVRTALRLERNTLARFEVNGPPVVYSYRLLLTGPSGEGADTKVSELGRLDWADWDHDGSLLFSERGCMYRGDLSVQGTGPKGRVKLVADLRDQVFANVLPPDEARVWP